MTNRTEQELIRIDKLQKLRKEGFTFPNDAAVNATSKNVLEAQVVEPEGSDRYTIAGRIVQQRIMGKAAFIHILDSEGKIQVYLKQDAIGAGTFDAFKEWDIGDIVEVKGYPFITKTGEKSLHAENIRLLTKSLIPLPEKWHGLTDIETRYRYRYVDLIANPDVRSVFKTRAKIVSEMRRFLDERNFIEVETPVLHYIPGGATAKPFKTHHNSLSLDMYLRIATELPLKKLVVGGLDKVYEIGRIFRNEGLSKKHNPEFTSIELYEGYATFEDHMCLLEEMLVSICTAVKGTLKIQYGDHEIDLTPPWPRITMVDSIHEIGGVPKEIDLRSLVEVQKTVAYHKIDLKDTSDWGRCIEALWGELVEPKLINPCFITHHPFSISPLARRNDKDLQLTDRYEMIMAGMETANGFSELNDPIDQRERLEAQAKRKEMGDEEASDVDEDFLRALEYGMPPTAGLGVGIDRLTMLITNSPSIRDVLLFPQLKPRTDEREEEIKGE